MLLYPDDKSPEIKWENWCKLVGCETVIALNELVSNGNIYELIKTNEALHEKMYSQVADMICQRNAKAVLLSGPSASGKTTSANRLLVQLRTCGKEPILISLDDYYIDRDMISPGPDGKLDFEHINTIDTVLFREHLSQLLLGETVELPSFDFKSGKRRWYNKTLKLSEKSVIIIEGLHALNPQLLPDNLDNKLIFRVYVSLQMPLKLDNQNLVPTSILRLLRRTVRDYRTRGSSVQQTMDMWDSVRSGEEYWVIPFQKNADVILNTTTLYELAVLKKHIYPLLIEVSPQDSCYEQVCSLVKILNYVKLADIDDIIPKTSLIREFIGGSSFYN